MQAQMLAPAAVLVAWTLIVMFWMMATRMPALAKSGIDLKKAKPGGRGQDLEGVLPDQTNWKGHNYAHLLEQPTLFYAAVVIVALLGATGADVLAAWGYVALRIVHSIWQATVNRVPVRLALFGLSTVCLIVLTVRALMLTLFA
ncbi:MAG: MAPEG family protein [Candidatus Andeanibacterium colombiense]|uniref:MAPEG family protein n=1 Tax=Candidatus Andeanibacterium colombiense TaxID=3121345 RepID=A0AAJ6BPU8_9SPHN|nr:MAG: MAPEG family protein [Sphingomonadaceae bacterium]